MQAIVIILRGCPAGWLGAYGNEWVATPNLDRLAAEAVVFDRHISDRPDAAAACAAWLGGAPQLPVLQQLRSANVHSLLVRANHPDTDAPDWFYAAWSEVFDTRPLEEDPSPLDHLLRRLPELLDRLAAHRDWLLWIEIDRLLPPWDVRQDVFDAYLEGDEESDANGAAVESEERDDEAPAPSPRVPPWSSPPTGLFDSTDVDGWEWLHATFAAVVTSLDAELGVLFDLLRDRGLGESAAWIVTADFGFPLGEHGQIGIHRPWLHEELVHLPLMVRLPGQAEACRRVSALTQPPDMASALLEVYGVVPASRVGLLSLARGAGGSPRSFAVTTLEREGAAEASLRTDEWAYLLPVRVPEGESREPMLFQKPDDRWEVNDLRRGNLERADELDQQLRAEKGSFYF